MIVALAGGVGGARLANGLAACLPPDRLTVVVNVGDDFEHLGLAICPDLDTVVYTMAGRNDDVRGWGLAGETWGFMDELCRLGGADWFSLGDRDLARHVFRTSRLRDGESLSSITAAFARQDGVANTIAPATDDAVRTMIMTDQGELGFQDYFVRHRWQPKFEGVRYAGAADATASPAFLQAMASPDLRGIVICPSNPQLSIGPMLAIPQVRSLLAERRVPCIAVSPFIAGAAVKGPAAKIMSELGQLANSASLASCYDGLLDGILCDLDDEASLADGITVRKCDTLMRDKAGQTRVAAEALALIDGIRGRSSGEMSLPVGAA